MALALFDLDNTLIAGDSDYSWGQFVVSNRLVDAGEYEARNNRFYDDYVNGELDVEAYLSFVLEPLKQFSQTELDELHAKFMRDYITPMLLPKASQLIEKHRSQGDLPVVITSTNRFITAPIAEKLGVKHLIASEPEKIDNRYTGNIVGTPCFREGKIVCLNAWLEQHGQSIDKAWFYSDSLNDIPLLEHVENPVAVDPDEALAAKAALSDWPIISLR